MKNWRIPVLALLFFLAFYGVFMQILSGWGAPVLFILLFATGLLLVAFYARVRDILRGTAISISIAAIFTHLISYLPSSDIYFRHHQRDFWPDLFLIAFICSGIGILVGLLARTLFRKVRRSPKTEVTVIGTFHGSMKTMKIYTPEKLRELLEATNPDVVAIEVRPQDLAQNTTKNNPWDMNEIVIPFAQQRKIPVEPFDWWLDDTREKAVKFYDELTKTAKGKEIFEYVEDEWRPFRARFSDFNEVTPEFVHSAEFARLEIEYRNEVTKLVGEGPQNLMWSERALRMNENLAKILALYPGKRMTIVTGAFHRPDIEQFLATRQDVKIVPLFK